MTAHFQPPKPDNPFSRGVAELRRRGHDVRPSDMPGLVLVSGMGELTMGQVASFDPSPRQ